MHRLFATIFASLTLGVACVLAAEPAKGKSPGDEAAAAFFKLRDDKAAALTPARIQELQAAGLGFLTTYPGHARAGNVISALAGFGSTIRDKKLAAMRDYWGSQLNYEIVTRRGRSDLTDEARLAFASLDTAYAGYVVRTAVSRDKLNEFRARIDGLAEMEGGARFLPGHEREYLNVLQVVNPVQAVAHARKLIAGNDKKLAEVGQEELNLIEIRRQPLELKATTLGGGAFDAAQLRGKVLYFVFWATTNEASVRELAALKDSYPSYKKQGVEIITVAHDADGEALAKFVKSKGYAWPVLFDGQGDKGEFGTRLNVRSPPASALFNQQGMFVATGVRSNRLAGELAKLGIKTK